jgi:hypothetical protein
VAHHARAKGSRSAGGASKGGSSSGLLSERELSDLESKYASGITAVQIVEVFVSRGVRFSEATFRKYVQQGLVPRSRRVGRKGKNRGSLGVYPAKAIRRINSIKELMAEGHTIEEIQSEFLQFTDVIERLEEGFEELFGEFEASLDQPRFDKKERKSLGKEIAEARKSADEILDRINGLSQRLSKGGADSYGGSGAAGSAEELL